MTNYWKVLLAFGLIKTCRRLAIRVINKIEGKNAKNRTWQFLIRTVLVESLDRALMMVRQAPEDIRLEATLELINAFREKKDFAKALTLLKEEIMSFKQKSLSERVSPSVLRASDNAFRLLLFSPLHEGNYSPELKNYEEALSLVYDHHDCFFNKEAICYCLLDIAQALLYREKHIKAEEILLDAAKLAKEIEDPDARQRVLTMLDKTGTKEPSVGEKILSFEKLRYIYRLS